MVLVSQFNSRITELTKSIDALTDAVSERVASKLFDELDALLTHRHQLISELISLHASGIGQEKLRDYLITVRHRDTRIMQMLQNESDHVKNSLLQLGKIKRYITV